MLLCVGLIVSYLEYETSGRRCLLLVSGLNTLSEGSIVIRHASNVYYCLYNRLSQGTVSGSFRARSRILCGYGCD